MSHYCVLIHYWEEWWSRNNVLPFHRSPFASAGSASLCRTSWEWRSTPTSASTLRRLICLRVCTCCDVKEKERGGQTGNLTFGPHRSAFVCVLSVHSQLNVLNYAEESRLMKDCCQTETKNSNNGCAKHKEGLRGSKSTLSPLLSKSALVLHHRLWRRLHLHQVDDTAACGVSQSGAMEYELNHCYTLLLTTEHRGNGLAQQSWCHRENNREMEQSDKFERQKGRQRRGWDTGWVKIKDNAV